MRCVDRTKIGGQDEKLGLSVESPSWDGEFDKVESDMLVVVALDWVCPLLGICEQRLTFLGRVDPYFHQYISTI